MFITFKPTDGDTQEWTFDAGRVRASAAEVIERRFGENWDQFVAGINSGNIRARRVLLWHLLTRDHATLRYEDTPDFFADELLVEFESHELTTMRERIATSAAVPTDKRESMLAAIDEALSEAVAREATQGKASSPD